MLIEHPPFSWSRDMQVGNKLRIPFLVLLISLLGWAVPAGATSFEDGTLVIEGRSWDDNHRGWVDAIPPGGVYEVFGMDVSSPNGSLVIDVLTNYHGGPEVVSGSLVTHAADMFIDVDRDGAFDYAVAGSDHGFDTSLAPVSRGALYDVRTTALRTSFDYFEGHAVDNFYGEAWDNPWDATGEPVPVPVAFEDGLQVGDTGLSWTPLGGGDPDYRVSLSLLLSDLGLVPGGTPGLLWSSANCANDIMAAEVHASPEPATMFLVGSGLIGLAALGRRRLKRPTGNHEV
jgi:hypothetical protein